MDRQVGDTVAHTRYSGATFKTEDGKEMLFSREGDILAIVD